MVGEDQLATGNLSFSVAFYYCVLVVVVVVGSGGGGGGDVFLFLETGA